MDQVVGAILGLDATRRAATSALPCAPVLREPKRRHRARHLLAAVLHPQGQSRTTRNAGRSFTGSRQVAATTGVDHHASHGTWRRSAGNRQARPAPCGPACD